MFPASRSAAEAGGTFLRADLAVERVKTGPRPRCLPPTGTAGAGGHATWKPARQPEERQRAGLRQRQLTRHLLMSGGKRNNYYK